MNQFIAKDDQNFDVNEEIKNSGIDFRALFQEEKQSGLMALLPLLSVILLLIILVLLLVKK